MTDIVAMAKNGKNIPQTHPDITPFNSNQKSVSIDNQSLKAETPKDWYQFNDDVQSPTFDEKENINYNMKKAYILSPPRRTRSKSPHSKRRENFKKITVKESQNGNGYHSLRQNKKNRKTYDESNESKQNEDINGNTKTTAFSFTNELNKDKKPRSRRNSMESKVNPYGHPNKGASPNSLV